MKANIELEVGDVVSLNSGGPDMTVTRIEGDQIECQWFEDTAYGYGDYKTGVFIPYVLSVVDCD